MAGQVTILRDGSTGDEGAGVEKGKGYLSGMVMNAIDGFKVKAGKPTHDGIASFMLDASALFELFYSILT